MVGTENSTQDAIRSKAITLMQDRWYITEMHFQNTFSGNDPNFDELPVREQICKQMSKRMMIKSHTMLSDMLHEIFRELNMCCSNFCCMYYLIRDSSKVKPCPIAHMYQVHVLNMILLCCVYFLGYMLGPQQHASVPINYVIAISFYLFSLN